MVDDVELDRMRKWNEEVKQECVKSETNEVEDGN